MKAIKGLILLFLSVIRVRAHCPLLIAHCLLLILASPSLESSSGQAFAVEVAPRISDKEIIESLAELKTGQKALQQQINDLKESNNKRFDDVNKRFDDVNKRFNDVNKRFDDFQESTNKRFDTLQWMLGLFITVALSIFGIMGKILWNQ